MLASSARLSQGPPTLRSSGAPTACCRCRPLSSNVRAHSLLFNLHTLAIIVALLLGGCVAGPTVEMVPVRNPSDGDTQVRLETFVYRPNGSGPFPVAILNHGSSGGDPKASMQWREEGEYLLKKGYVVLAPMRRGRGKSAGMSPESEDKNCDVSSWLPGLAVSIRDIDATVEFAQTIPGIRKHEVLLVGVSRGGFLSVAYAAEGKYRGDIKGVINFVGGWVAQAEDKCPIDFNLKAFEKFGSSAKAPMLWLYGASDLFYGDEATISYHAAFQRGGGHAEFHLIDGVAKNGHWLISQPNLWKDYASTFLRLQGAP